MDFKVAGTSEGITAVQMDVKVEGVPLAVLAEAFAQAKKARMQILDVILKAIPASRPAISPRAPEILVVKVKPDQIGLVIGSGGKTINGIRDESGVTDITIEEDGTVYITGTNGSAGKAKTMVEELVKEYKAGEIYEGEVTRMLDFGAFVKIGKNAEGLVHVSEIAPFRINKIGDVLSMGEKVRVIIKEIDEKQRINLSIKAIDPEFATRKGLSGSAQPPARS
jgi:polyribonucleotide nucleotidyltransferase